MGFFDFLERLQRRPDSHKEVIALALASVFTLAIAAVWTRNFSLRPLQVAQEESALISLKGNTEEISPLASLGQAGREILDFAKEVIESTVHYSR